MREKLEIAEGDLTELKVAAIVNAADPGFLGGGGLDGAIHRVAGPPLLEECRGLGGCRTGESKITPGYRFPATHVFHTVGPIWRGGGAGEAKKLAACYTFTLDLALENQRLSIAFPAISTGVYGYPIELPTRVAITTVSAHVAAVVSLQKVIFCCFGRNLTDTYKHLIRANFKNTGV